MTNKQKFPTCTDNAKSYFSQFTGATSIHGVQFLGEKGRFVIEKLIWLVYIILIGCCCIYLILQAYNKWVTQPVLVSFSTSESPIWDIPFPAITICPEVKYDKAKFNYSNILEKRLNEIPNTDRENEFIEALSLVCDGFSYFDVTPFNLKLRRFVKPPYKSLQEVSVDFDKFPLNPTFMGKNISFTEFQKVFTNEGLCYTFNMIDDDEIFRKPTDLIVNEVDEAMLQVTLEFLNKSLQNFTQNDIKNWNMEQGYSSNKIDLNEYPRRSFLAGSDGGFEIMLYTNHSNLDNLCGNILKGFKVSLHYPTELPNMDQHFQVPLDQMVQIRVKPRVIKVSEKLKSYKPEDRKCYFPDERSLYLYKDYSQENCMNECLANYTLSKCNCLDYFMVGIKNSTNICGPASSDCLQQSKINYLLYQNMFEKGFSFDEDEDETLDAPDCDCLPSCTNVQYDVEISQSEFDFGSIFRTYSEVFGANVSSVYDLQKDHFSYLKVYYKDRQFLSSERNELYGYVDFFSSTGGLLGLFIGISVTSGVEILYFLTLRLACNIKKYGKRFWSGDEELIEAAEI